MMKRLLLVAACAGLWFTFGAASPASADNGPHVQGAGIVADGCAGCHRTHTAQASKILKQAQPGLCLTCHGSAGTGAKTNVEGGLGYADGARGAPTGALRGGGFNFALINSAAPTGQDNGGFNTTGDVPALALTAGAGTTSSHSIDLSPQTAWGNTSTGSTALGKTVALTCGSCHDPHGNGNYRVLKALPTDSGATVPLSITDTAVAKVYTTANYWKADDASAPAFIANVSAWCTTCHTRYLGGDGAARTNSGDAVFTYKHKSNSTTAGGASCIQCHVSHGSNASMGGVNSAAAGKLNPGSTTPETLGSSKLLRIDNRGTCQMCHNK